MVNQKDSVQVDLNQKPVEKWEITSEKKFYYNELKRMRIPSTFIEEEYKKDFRLKKDTLEELVAKANLEQIKEIYDEVRFAGKVSINLLYMEGFIDYTISDFKQIAQNYILNFLKKEEGLQINKPHFLMFDSKLYVFFDNFRAKTTIYNKATRTYSEGIKPDFPVIVFSEKSPIVQIRSSRKSSINLCRKLLLHYTKTYSSMKCSFDNPNFREGILNMFDKATTVGLLNPKSTRTTQNVQLSDTDGVLHKDIYLDHKKAGAVEKYVYVKGKNRKHAVHINFEKDKFIFKKFTSEGIINEIFEIILGVANQVDLFKARIHVPSFLKRDE